MIGAKMRRNIFIVLTMILLLSCPKKEIKTETKNLEQIYKEQGIPIKQEIIQPISFKRYLKYNAVLMGKKQTTVSSIVNDKIEKIQFGVGQSVSVNDIVITFPNDNPSAQYKQALAAYNNSKLMRERMAGLLNEGGMSQQDYDNLQTQEDVNAANLNSALKALQVQAPFNGIITDMKVSDAEEVESGTALFTIADMDQLRCKIWVDEDDVCFMKKGMNAKALWKGHILDGKILSVALSKDSEKKAFHVELLFDNPGKFVYCGVTADIEIEIYHNDTAITIERKIVRNDPKGSYVWLNLSRKAMKKYIEIGQQRESKLEISKGLKIGDKLIVEGIDLLSDQVKVKIK